MTDPLKPAEARALIERLRAAADANAGMAPLLHRAADALEATLPRPIEKAPWEGTQFMALVDDDIRRVAWTKASHVPLYGWCVVDLGAEDVDLCEPTLWWPLPRTDDD